MDQKDDKSETPDPAPPKPPRGFAAMDPARQRELARQGGRASQLAGTAHRLTPETAREAGRKGGQVWGAMRRARAAARAAARGQA